LEMVEHRPMTSMAIKKAEFVRLKAAPIAKLDSNRSYKSYHKPRIFPSRRGSHKERRKVRLRRQKLKSNEMVSEPAGVT